MNQKLYKVVKLNFRLILSGILINGPLKKALARIVELDIHSRQIIGTNHLDNDLITLPYQNLNACSKPILGQISGPRVLSPYALKLSTRDY